MDSKRCLNPDAREAVHLLFTNTCLHNLGPDAPLRVDCEACLQEAFDDILMQGYAEGFEDCADLAKKTNSPEAERLIRQKLSVLKAADVSDADSYLSETKEEPHEYK